MVAFWKLAVQGSLGFLISIFAVLVTCEPASAAWFNCNGSKLLPDERTVCSDATLSRMDEDLNSIYKEIVDSRSEVPATIGEQERRNQRAFYLNASRVPLTSVAFVPCTPRVLPN